jgi:cytochrome c-type biogenesis protein CcmH/NrfG
LSPKNPRVFISLASFLAEHSLKLDEALKLSRLAVQAEPNNADYLDTLGWVQFQRGDLSEADATLKRALALAGEEPPAPEIREHLKKLGEKKGIPPK